MKKMPLANNPSFVLAAIALITLLVGVVSGWFLSDRPGVGLAAAVGCALLLGFLLGWFIEWRIDLSYWRSYFEEDTAIEQTPVMVLPAREALQLPPAAEELLAQTLREHLAQREADLGALRAEMAERERDWREREERARQSGEWTIEQLNANEARWREVLTAREGELLEDTRRLRAEVEELLAARNDADAERRHELARREQQWQESKETEVASLQTDNQQLETKLADVEQRFARYRSSHADDLALINGIGPKLQDDLRRHGIHSYAELARCTPDELRRLLKPPKWRRLDFEGWIAEAQARARDNEA